MKLVNKAVKELQDVTITHVSYVKRGANKLQFLLAKSESQQPDVEFDVRVVKDENSPKQLLYGIVYEPDVTDAHGDIMNSAEIEKMAHEFIVHYRNIDKEHNLIAGAGQVVESYVAPVDFEIGKSTVKAGSWILVTKANDEIWNDYLSGEITGYSMFGIARKTVAKAETEISWLQKALEKLGLIKSFDDTLNEIVNYMKTSPSFILDVMQEEFWKNIEWDNTREEDLGVLSKAMKEAANYIDTTLLIGVAKSEESMTQEQEVVTTEPEIPETTETTETQPEPEVITNEEVAILQKNVEQLIAEKEEIIKQLEDVKLQLEKSAVQSSVVTTVNTVEIKQPKPQIF